MNEERPAPRDEAPPGYQWEAADAGLKWRLLDPWERQRCRAGAGFRRPGCGRPAVAELSRNTRGWYYCADHLYGSWIEDGRVLHWRLSPNEASRS